MSNPRDITMAEARAMLRSIRTDLALIEARLHRRSPTRRAKITSARMTPALRQRIRDMAAASPDMAMQAIAQALRVNVGRVSEVLARPVAQPEYEQPALPEGDTT